MVEYLVVGALAVILIAALGAILRFAADGSLAALLHQGTSHAVGTLGGIADVFAY